MKESMIQKKSLALTPDQSRVARRELGLSQRDVIQKTGIPSYKIKQWEGRGLSLDVDDLQKLRGFYEASGADFDEIAQDTTPNGGAGGAPSGAFTSTPRPGFFISSDLPGAVVDKLMSDMEISDDRIADIIKGEIKKGIFGNLSEETEVQIQELYGHLAMNHLRFRCLQGRNIIEPTRNEGKTVGNYLALWVDGLGVFMPTSERQEAPKARADDSLVDGQARDEEQE
jgi:transcriptional regulator with XRE-family HTH domain